MKTEFMVAIRQISAEKNLPKDIVLAALESALVTAYKKENFSPGQEISVKINPNSGEERVYVHRIVVESPEDDRVEIKLNDAQKIRKDAKLGDIVLTEVRLPSTGRIVAQITRQVWMQKLHEAERHAILEEFSGKEGDIVVGIVQKIDPKQIYIDLGNAEGILPAPEQIKGERYRQGQRLRLYLMEVARGNRGPMVIVSRSHRNFLRRLLELEVPEIYNGVVEIKAVAREAGFRSKVAVAAKQEGIDAVGCCVGLRGIRIQSIVNELNGEKIDVIQWHPDPQVYIANALSPAQVLSVLFNEEDSAAMVIVPDKQLSLAIGKEGQNARLTAKLTGWRIDIKSLSVFEKEKLPIQASVTKEEAKEEILTEPKAAEDISAAVAQEIPEAATEPVPTEEKGATPVVEYTLPPEIAAVKPKEKKQVRFAEEILPGRGVATDTRKKKADRKDRDDGKGAKKKTRIIPESDVWIDEVNTDE